MGHFPKTACKPFASKHMRSALYLVVPLAEALAFSYARDKSSVQVATIRERIIRGPWHPTRSGILPLCHQVQFTQAMQIVMHIFKVESGLSEIYQLISRDLSPRVRLVRGFNANLLLIAIKRPVPHNFRLLHQVIPMTILQVCIAATLFAGKAQVSVLSTYVSRTLI